MQINPDEITSILRSRIEGLGSDAAELTEVGTVLSVSDGIARLHGVDNCMSFEMLELPHGVTGLALNLESDNVGAVLFGEWEHISEGDTVRRTGSLLDIPVGEQLLGRIVDPLGRPLDGKGAINVGISVSRVGGNAQMGPMKKVAGRIKLELSQYRDLEAFAQFGSDLDVDTQRTLARGERLVATLNQGERAPLPVEDQTVQIFAATNGFLDRLLVERVPDFLLGLTERMHSEHEALRARIAGGDWSEELQEQLRNAVDAYAQDFGYDLDEEGQPLAEGKELEGARAA